VPIAGFAGSIASDFADTSPAGLGVVATGSAATELPLVCSACCSLTLNSPDGVEPLVTFEMLPNPYF
jgi:hypothetical protein